MTREYTPPTQARLQAEYAYDPATGELTRRHKRGRYPAGGLAGKVNGKGFRIIKIDGRVYTVARIIWCIVTGVLPTKYIRFRDGDRGNLRAVNLYLSRQLEAS